MRLDGMEDATVSDANKTAVVVDGKRDVHATSQTGAYQTLCGLDGDDPTVGQTKSRVLPGEKITCPDCKAMWLEAKRYRRGDFA